MFVTTQRKELQEVEQVNRREHMRVGIEREDHSGQFTGDSVFKKSPVGLKLCMASMVDHGWDEHITLSTQISPLFVVLRLDADMLWPWDIELRRQFPVACREFIETPCPVTVPLS
jgi:hypothetical protein